MRTQFRFVVCIILMVAFRWANGLSVDTAYMVSKYHTPDSSRIFLVANVLVNSSPCSVHNVSVVNSDSLIDIRLCYMGGALQFTCPRSDTFDLGVKKNGDINILAVFQTYFNDTCKGSAFFKDTFVFKISTEVSDIGKSTNLNNVCLYPNPATTQLVIECQDLEIAEVNIYNATASLMMAVQLNSKYYLLNTEALAPGIYIAVIKTQQGSVRKRWVKM